MISRKPKSMQLREFIDLYFYMDILVKDLQVKKEPIIPFPRITFGYFFNAPFLVSNLRKNEHRRADMIISRIIPDPITVMPLTDRVQILGAHLKPWGLAAFTDEDISSWPWLIDTENLFGTVAGRFRTSIVDRQDPEAMFELVESAFLDTFIDKDLSVIISLVNEIEREKGQISVAELAARHHLSTRTLRNYFSKNIGCAPKDFLQIVKVNQSVQQMQSTDHSLTRLTYEHDFDDQAHFTHTIKNMTGLSPKQIRENMDRFRFLQF